MGMLQDAQQPMPAGQPQEAPVQPADAQAPPQGLPPEQVPPQGVPPEQAPQGLPPEQPVQAAPEGPSSADEEVSPEEQAEFDRVTDAVDTVLYSNDETSRALLDHIQPEDKRGSTAKAAMLLIKQIDEKVNMDEIVIAGVLKFIIDRLTDLGEQVKNIEYSESDLQAITGAAWEGAMGIFGIEEGDGEAMLQGMSEQEIKEQESTYNQFLGAGGAPSAMPGNQEAV